MGLANKILKKVNESATIKGMLADAFNKSHQTIQRWIDNNDERLTTIKALSIIERETGLTQAQVIEK